MWLVVDLSAMEKLLNKLLPGVGLDSIDVHCHGMVLTALEYVFLLLVMLKPVSKTGTRMTPRSSPVMLQLLWWVALSNMPSGLYLNSLLMRGPSSDLSPVLSFDGSSLGYLLASRMAQVSDLLSEMLLKLLTASLVSVSAASA